MNEKIAERKRMNHFVSPEVAELFELFHEAQDPPLNKSVLHEITLTRGMFFDRDTILELRNLLNSAEEVLTHRDDYMTQHWNKNAKKAAAKLRNFITDMEVVK